MKLRNRILIAYLSLAALVAAVGGGGFVALERVRGEFDAAVGRTQPVLETLQELRYEATRLTLDVARTPSPTPSPGSFAVLDSSPLEASLRRYLALVERYFPDEREFAGQINGHAVRLLADLRLLAAQDEALRHERLHAVIDDSYDCLTRLNEAIEVALRVERAEFEEQRELVTGHINRHRAMFAAGSGLALLVALAGAWGMARRITRPIERLHEAVRQLGSGALETRVRSPGGDEIGDLGQGFDRMAEELKHSMVTRDYVEAIIESISDGILVVGRNGVIERSNSAMRALCGDEFKGPLAGRLVDQILDYEEGVEALLGAPFLRYGFECRVARADGAGPAVAVTASLIEFGERRGGRVLVVRELPLAQETKRGLAGSDVADQRAVFERLQELLPRLPWRGRNIGVVLCAIDRMAEFAEVLGHDASEAVVDRLGETLREALRPGDVVGRLQPDTLAVILEDVATETDLLPIGEKLRARMTRPLALGQHQIQLAVSVGMACAPGHGLDAEVLIGCAEAALRDARGGTRCVLFPLPGPIPGAAPDRGRRPPGSGQARVAT